MLLLGADSGGIDGCSSGNTSAADAPFIILDCSILSLFLGNTFGIIDSNLSI